MIIAGHSGVDAFRQSGLRFSVKAEKIVVSWVGAIKVAQFYKGHPAGAKVRNLFANEAGWKILSIGGHDIFELCTFASMGKVADHFEEAFEAAVRSYAEVFKELSGPGKFAWLVFPQPVSIVTFKNFTTEDVLKVAKRFNQRIESLCAELGVTVINPLSKITGQDGRVLTEVVQQDGAHLNINGVKAYVEEIESVTGEKLFFRPDTVIFESASEVESFCSLFLGELQIPANDGETAQVARNTLIEFVAKNLQDSGGAGAVGAGTKLLSAGLVDEVFFNNLCGYASDLLCAPGLRDTHFAGLDTIDEVVNKLSSLKRAASGEAYEMLCQQDFFTSLHGNYDDIAQREAILRADEKISIMSDDLFAKMHEIVPLNSRDALLNYGIIPFWYALNYARRGNYVEALRLMAQSGNQLILPNGKPGKINFPFASSRVELYRQEWEMRIEEKLPIWRRISHPLHRKLLAPVKQVILYLVYYRFLLRIWRLMGRVMSKVRQ